MFYNKKIFERCFDYKGKYWYKNLLYIPTYFKQIHYLMKYGYDPYATWNMDFWFIDTMKHILKEYSSDRSGTPILIDNFPMVSIMDDDQKALVELNDKMWDDIINRMIELLGLMDECNEIYEEYDWKQTEDAIEKAKTEFFALFSEHFYRLWD